MSVESLLATAPQGDALVVGSGAAADRTVNGLSQRAIAVVQVLPHHSPAAAGDAHALVRRLPAGLLPYPPASFATCWWGDAEPPGPHISRLLRTDGLLASVDGAPLPCEPTAGISAPEDCVFCPALRFEFNQMAELPGAAGVLWGDDDIFVMPDLAPLAEGHLLIVTTRHVMCMGAIPPELWPVLVGARDMVARLFQLAYRTGVLLFEHGPARPQAAGACIDHAHWHCLPATVDIRPVVEAHGLHGVPAGLSDLRDMHQRGTSYLYVENRGAGWACSAEELPAQFLRAATTTALAGVATPTETWRWQESIALPATRDRHYATLRRLLPLADSLLRE